MNLYRSILVAGLMLAMFIVLACEKEVEFSLGEPEVVTSGFRFTEGPIWQPEGFLLFSDIPASIIYKWTPGDPESEVFIEPSGNSNGIKVLPDGTLIVAQHAGRVSIVTEDRELETVADQYDGKRLNSPNDIAVRSDGLVYFTDPDFGVSDENKELDFQGVYRINHDGSLTVVFDEFALPNGIVFSPDENYLYVNDSATGDIRRFEVMDNGDLGDSILFANIGEMGQLGGADGMVVDGYGRLYTTGPHGFIVFDSAGEQVAQIRFEQQITNLAWGGEDGNDLFITSRGDVYRLRVNK
jgi:gluconolactonase